MAHPDTDDGWLKYAHELDAALAAADFSKGARIVLREVFAQIFGPAKQKTAELSPSDIARRIGRSKGTVGNRITELVESRVLVRVGSRYAFRKDYETWVRVVRRLPDGSVETVPRLTPAEVQWCRAAPKHALSFVPVPESARRKDREPINVSDSVGSLSREREGEERSLSRERSVLYPENGAFSIQRTERSLSRERPLSESLPENIAATSDAATSAGGSLTRGRAPASEETIETRETTQSSRIVCETGDDTHTPGPEIPGSTPQRDEADYADVRMAASILASDLRTTHLGTELLRQHNLPGLLVLEGWRWVLAANAILGAGIEDRKRRSFPYLVGIARGFDPADRTSAPAPAVNGHLPTPAAPRAESPSERRRRELKESLNAFKVPGPTEGESDAR
jgi:hypothetical protein